MAKKLFWIDLEMTGLDEKVDHILEVAVVVTDLDLKPLDQFHRIVFQPQQVLDSMNDWCKHHHGASGLTQEVPNGTPLAQVDQELRVFIDQHFSADSKVVLVGNSVGNDQRFVLAYLPKVSERLHYRVVDVSSYKEIFRDKWGLKFEKKNAHRAIGDIHESIRELEYYLGFVKPTP